MTYTPVNGVMEDNLILAIQHFIGWGSINFIYFILLMLVLVILWRFVNE